jgi:hypothetical protein
MPGGPPVNLLECPTRAGGPVRHRHQIWGRGSGSHPAAAPPRPRRPVPERLPGPDAVPADGRTPRSQPPQEWRQASVSGAFSAFPASRCHRIPANRLDEVLDLVPPASSTGRPDVPRLRQAAAGGRPAPARRETFRPRQPRVAGALFEASLAPHFEPFSCNRRLVESRSASRHSMRAIARHSSRYINPLNAPARARVTGVYI